jgi:hypothetical protein
MPSVPRFPLSGFYEAKLVTRRVGVAAQILEVAPDQFLRFRGRLYQAMAYVYMGCRQLSQR